MNFVHGQDMPDMLGAAGRAASAPVGSGRSELIDRLASFRAQLPVPLRRRVPADLPSSLLLVAYSLTVIAAVGGIAQAIGQPDSIALIALASVYLAVGLAGLWFTRNLYVVVPATLLWFLLAQVSFLSFSRSYFWALAFGAAGILGLWVAVRSVVGRRTAVRRAARAAEAATNQLGWDLYKLSSELRTTDERLSGIAVYGDLRIGELQRHFDQVISAAIRGGMEHAFRFKGWTTAVHGLPGYFDTASHSSMGGGGVSSVQLGLSGTTADELRGEAFIAVFEQGSGDGVDTIRAVVPSERQSRDSVAQVLASWSAQARPNSNAELMIRRYAGAITNAVSSESSYVGDRLNALLRLPASERPAVTVIGQPLDGHTILVGAVRFGSTGPLYQLFPIALIRALEALIEGRPLPPQPPSGLPPADGTAEPNADTETAERVSPAVAESNGHIPDLQIRTLGSLRIRAGAEDITSALLDRKVLAFLWLHLFARTLRNPDDSITRSSLADELSPGLDSSAQRSRLRGRLSELRNQLPAPLGRRVKVEGERIRLDLDGCAIDVRDVAEAVKSCGNSNGVLTSEQLAQIESLVDGVEGRFLPEWDDVEEHVNSGRSGAGEVVDDIRRRADAAIATLLRTLGTGYLAHGKAEAALAPLERALAIGPDDEAAARVLASACAQTGRLARAEELRKEFSLV